MQIPFYRPSLTQAEKSEVLACLDSGWLTTGPRTKTFEQEFAAYVGQKHGVALNSCTAALHLALEAIGIKAGDAVVLPTMTFAATAEVVRYFNAHPLLVDCRPQDFNMDTGDARRRIESALAQEQNVRAIIPVHYGGQIGDVAGIAALARQYKLHVVEDAAHCCPAYYRSTKVQPKEPRARTAAQHNGGNGKAGPVKHWQPVGASADITCFSFYANKCITTGEGGMACTQQDEYAERMRIMSLHGISKDAWKRFTAAGSWYYEIVAPGYKYNLTDIAAAIGLHQLRRADDLHRKRAFCARLYTELLSDVEELVLPEQQPDRVHSWHLYVIRLKVGLLNLNRGEVVESLKKKGITTSVHWMPLHQHPYYRQRYRYEPEDFPVAAQVYPEIITLPLFPDMTEAEVAYVCESLKTIIAAHRRPIAGRRSLVPRGNARFIASSHG